MAAPVEHLLPRHARVLIGLERSLAGLEPGTRLPSERDLASRFRVSREPVRRALAALARRGLLEARRGSGTWLRRRPAAPAAAAAPARLIGLSVPSLRWPPIARLVEGAEAEARRRGCLLALAHDDGDPAVQRRQLATLLERGVDGLLVLLDQDNVGRGDVRRLLRRSLAGGRRIALLDRPVAGVELACVMTDTTAGTYAAVRHLVELGRRRLAVLSWGDAAGRADADRWAGLRAAAGGDAAIVRHAALGYPPDQCEAARAAVAGWLARDRGRPRFDAIVAFVDDFALGAWFALRAAGLRVPADVAVTGFDDVDPGLYRAHGLDLTTVAQPFEDLGRIGVETLLDDATAAGVPRSTRHVLLRPRLIERASTLGAAPGVAPRAARRR